ncbi:hypothetical protein [Paraburkholderia sp.]|uniref:hypothetical protein n=1 Tax=Paraburkholderia sp. TaxID=1926495 RepID=UPI003D6FD356
MQLQISEYGFVTLSQYGPERNGEIIVRCDEHSCEIVKSTVKKECHGHWRTHDSALSVLSVNSIVLFNTLYELNRPYAQKTNQAGSSAPT